MNINGNKKFILLILGVLTACKTIKHSVVVENNQSVYYGKEEKFRFVKIQRGQTVSEIAEEYNVPIREIKRLNSLNSYDNVSVGQVIKVPIGNYYFVRENDTLENIARIHDVDLNLLAEANDLSVKSEVYVGNYVKIPETKSTFVETKGNQHVDFESTEILDLDQEQNEHIEQKKDLDVLTATGSVSVVHKPKVSSKFFKNDTPINSKDFIWPIHGKVIKKYGDHDGKFNEGINIAANKGIVIKAAAKGQIAYTGAQKGYGNLIIIRHNNGYMTAYAHIDKILVKKGQIINKGTQIATVGNSGNVDQPQLQFSMKKGNHTINPDS